MDSVSHGATLARTRAHDLDARVLLTRAASLRPLLVHLDEIGAPTNRLLVSAGLSAELSDEPDVLVPLHLVHRFVELAAVSQGLDDLGARLAHRVSAFDLAFLGPALRQAVTVYDYLQTGIRLIGQVTKSERIWLTLEQDQVRIHHEGPGRASLGRLHEDMFCMVMTVRMLREFLGPKWSPIQVDLLAADGRVVGDLEVFGDAALRFGQPHSSLSIHASVLQRCIRDRSDVAGARDSGTVQIEPAMPVTFLDSIEKLVESLVLVGALRIEMVAESAGMSPRTLQRRLGELGQSYSDVVHRSRIRLASDWLTSTTLPVRDIATALGYTDPANFTRAFRRTTGIPPKDFRRAH